VKRVFPCVKLTYPCHDVEFNFNFKNIILIRRYKELIHKKLPFKWFYIDNSFIKGYKKLIRINNKQEIFYGGIYMNRRKSREIATRLIFEMSINKESYVDIIENFRENTEEKIEDIDFEYVIRVLKGVSENEAQINETITKYLVKWKLERLPKMNLAILKMATYEILFDEDIPNKVTINEAIELAKRYGDDNAPSFINGVLNNLIKK